MTLSRRSGLLTRWRYRHVEVMRVQPGDVIVYHPEPRLTQAHFEAIFEVLGGLFPNNKVAILEDGVIQVVRPEDREI